ncbi:unnamed protein product [Strongylus vulgaris]|uniref:Uncharacterized protein n=1 Tax=Strongylus vulgaris TaxID=40348 RepID=A0A3P7ITK0_STRVU|nr:unnamed protein product [Strongylus vulgaris]
MVRHILRSTTFLPTEGGAYWTSRCRKLVKKICHRVEGRREVEYDGVRLEELLTICDWPTEEDPTKDYDLLLRGLKACGENASTPQKT